MAKIYVCEECGFSHVFWDGCGMMYPLVHKDAVEKAKAGGYGAGLRKLFAEYPEGDIDISYSAYICPECSDWKDLRCLDFYAPGTGENENAWNIPDGYKLLKKRSHKCRACGCERKKVDIAGEEDTVLKCPQCGGKMVSDGMLCID